jgi:hypothetical protein
MPFPSPPLTAEQIAASEAFDALYARWLVARAAKINVDDDAIWTKRDQELDEIEIRLLSTNAPSERALWQKLEVCEVAVQLAQSIEDVSRVLFALGAIKADLARVGLGG